MSYTIRKIETGAVVVRFSVTPHGVDVLEGAFPSQGLQDRVEQAVISLGPDWGMKRVFSGSGLFQQGMVLTGG